MQGGQRRSAKSRGGAGLPNSSMVADWGRYMEAQALDDNSNPQSPFKRRLGRGLNALLGSGSDESADNRGYSGPPTIPITEIRKREQRFLTLFCIETFRVPGRTVSTLVARKRTELRVALLRLRHPLPTPDTLTNWLGGEPLRLLQR